MEHNTAADLTRYCAEICEDPDALHINATAADYNAFLRWTLDHYPRVRFGSTLDLCWRILKMRYLDRTGRFVNEGIARDVTNVSSCAHCPNQDSGILNFCPVQEDPTERIPSPTIHTHKAGSIR